MINSGQVRFPQPIVFKLKTKVSIYAEHVVQYNFGCFSTLRPILKIQDIRLLKLANTFHIKIPIWIVTREKVALLENRIKESSHQLAR